MPEPVLCADRETEAQRASEESLTQYGPLGPGVTPRALGSFHPSVCAGESLWPSSWELGATLRVWGLCPGGPGGEGQSWPIQAEGNVCRAVKAGLE